MTKPFKPMLASPLNEECIEAFLATGKPLFISPKLDGIRCVIRDGVAYGRSLKPLPNEFVQATIAKIAPNGSDGEVVVGLPTSPTVYHDTYSGVMTIKGQPEVTFWMFDNFTHPEKPYIERIADQTTVNNIRVLPSKMVKTMRDILEYEQIFLEQGFEGAMIRNLNSPYKYGRATERSLDLMKIKREVDAEALILGIYPAYENQNEAFTNELGHTERSSHAENKVALNMAGGFYLEKDGVEFKCSMGKFNHAQRRWIWENRETLVGKRFIKYRYFEYGVKEAPRFPRALGFRDPIDM